MTKAAILIDGGYFLKRLPFVRPNVDSRDADAVAQCVDQLIQGHLKQLNKLHNASNFYKLLYRSFYYDARPYEQKAHTPVQKQSVDYAKTAQAVFRKRLFRALRGRPNLAVP